MWLCRRQQSMRPLNEHLPLSRVATGLLATTLVNELRCLHHVCMTRVKGTLPSTSLSEELADTPMLW
jgi:hypothetical protein